MEKTEKNTSSFLKNNVFDDAKIPLVYIVLLNYQHVEETLTCLESLKGLDYPEYKIVVVDNASRDGSVETLKEVLEKDKSYEHLIEAEENLGFSTGVNMGIDYAMTQEADHIWVLNNDTTVEPTALNHLVERSEKTGTMSGSILLYPDKSYQQAGTEINWKTGSAKGIPETELEDGMDLECMTGASMLIPRRIIQQIGKFDESYFLYFEDGEYSLRAGEAGFIPTLAARSRVYHKQGASTGKNNPMVKYYYQRNRLKLLFRYAFGFERLTIFVYTWFRVLRSWVKAKLNGTPDRQQEAKIQLQATLDYFKGINGKCPHQF